MHYSKSILLYQDEPTYGFLLRLIFIIVPVILLVGSIYLLSSGESTDAILLLVEAFIVGLIFWSVLPRSYQVYENHLCIVLGRPFSIKVGFSDIEAIGITSRLILSINFVTKFSKSYVEINKKKGFSIAITTKDYELFVENANKALSQWIKTKTG